MLTCEVLNIGRTDYDSALELQEKLVARKAQGVGTDYLILVEHEPVVTIGRKGSDDDIRCGVDDLRNQGIQVKSTKRGGAATYHGPGHMVGYPVVDLNRLGRDIHAYLRRLETVIINAISTIGVSAERRPGLTGVWTASGKIASIGVAVRRWITYHGFAVNVGHDLSGFEGIIPCGMDDCRMTSVSAELARNVSLEEFADVLLPAFGDEFGYNLTTREKTSSMEGAS